GPQAPPAKPAGNPQVNVGTGKLDRERWAPVVEAFTGALGAREVAGRPLEVRENVKFRGGHFSHWIHQRYPRASCALAIEVKKFFMDEWTGEPEREFIREVGEALAATVAPVLATLQEVE
ncbi:MAG: N-formylglutamate amidohydrolase, partial [Longimicrobiaceae bacterium]